MAEMPMPEHMGYDRASVVFSPEGRLYQVEYARQAVEKATTTLGIVFQGGVVLMASKTLHELLVPESSEKIFSIDEHIGAAACGLIADSRVLIDFARIRAQVNRITYDEPIEIKALVNEISDRKQVFTQYAGMRPYGVSMLIAGSDGSHHLYETDPSGTIREWKAQAIGRGAEPAKKALIKDFKDGMTEQDAIQLGMKALESAEKKISPRALEIGVVRGRKFFMLNQDDIKKMLKK